MVPCLSILLVAVGFQLALAQSRPERLSAWIPSTAPTAIKKDILETKRQLDATSAQDEFAKWAKLRRTHDRLVASYDKMVAEAQATQAWNTQIASWSVWLLVWSIQLSLLVYWYREPMFYIPSDWLGSFFTDWMPWPFAPTGKLIQLLFNLFDRLIASFRLSQCILLVLRVSQCFVSIHISINRFIPPPSHRQPTCQCWH